MRTSTHRWGLRTVQRTLVNHGWITLVGLNFLVAITGYIKDVITASYFGTGVFGDAYTTAYFIIDLVGITALGNAVGVASAAVFGRLVNGHANYFMRIVQRLLWLVVALSAGLAVVLVALRWPLLLPFHAHDSGIVMDKLYFLLVPAVIVYPLFYFLSGILQSLGRFAISVGAPSLLNLIVGATGWLLMHAGVPVSRGSQFIALSVPVGAIFITLLLIIYWSVVRSPSARGSNGGFDEISPENWRAESRLFLAILLSYALYLSLTQGLGLIERYIVAFRLAPGSLAAMTYAGRISQIPNWVFMSAVGTWLLPHMSRAFGGREYDEFSAMVKSGLQFGMVVCIPISIIFTVLREPIVEILFQRHAFTTSSTQLTASFLAGYACAIVFQALSAFLFRAIAVTASLWHAIPFAAAGVILSTVVELCLVRMIGPTAIGIGEAVGSLLMAALLWLQIRRYDPKPTVMRWEKGISIILSNIVVIMLAMAANWGFLFHFANSPWRYQVIYLAVSMLCIAALYIGIYAVSSKSPSWGLDRGRG